jgi:hypothetical protein
MRLASATIENIRNIEFLEIKFGWVTVVSGTNEAGKTSALRSIMLPFEGGHHPEAIRRDEDEDGNLVVVPERKARIELFMDNGITVTEWISQNGYDISVKTADDVEIPKPATFLKTLAGGFSFDPVSFIGAKKAERLKYLLEAMPIEFSTKELLATSIEKNSGKTTATIADALAEKPTVEILTLADMDALLKRVEEARRVANVSREREEKTVMSLQFTLPKDDETDWAKEAQEFETERREVERQFGEAQANVRASAAREEQAIKDDCAARIKIIEQERDKRIAETRDALVVSLAENESLIQPERERLASESAAARERATAQTKAAGTRDLIATAKGAVKDLSKTWNRLDATMKAIDKAKKEKLAALPLEGVDIRNGEICVNGLPFDDLNDAQKYTWAFKIGALTSGKLPLIIADGAERLEETTTFQDILAAAKDSGYQVILARVAPGPRKIAVVA